MPHWSCWRRLAILNGSRDINSGKRNAARTLHERWVERKSLSTWDGHDAAWTPATSVARRRHAAARGVERRGEASPDGRPPRACGEGPLEVAGGRRALPVGGEQPGRRGQRPG